MPSLVELAQRILATAKRLDIASSSTLPGWRDTVTGNEVRLDTTEIKEELRGIVQELLERLDGETVDPTAFDQRN
jgi:hypothetical protein